MHTHTHQSRVGSHVGQRDLNLGMSRRQHERPGVLSGHGHDHRVLVDDLRRVRGLHDRHRVHVVVLPQQFAPAHVAGGARGVPGDSPGDVVLGQGAQGERRVPAVQAAAAAASRDAVAGLGAGGRGGRTHGGQGVLAAGHVTAHAGPEDSARRAGPGPVAGRSALFPFCRRERQRRP
ncbi:unnamed protein product, partial [Ixodes persulcatus]